MQDKKLVQDKKNLVSTDKNELYEYCLIQYIAQKVKKELHMSYVDFASLVWPELTRNHATQKWKSIRLSSRNTGKPQGLLIRDAKKMAEILGTEFAYLIMQATLRFEKHLLITE